MLRSAVLMLFGLGALLPVQAQVFKDLPLPGTKHDAVEFVSPQQITVTAHQSAEVELHFHIADGLHINSHKPLDKTLIPTRLAVVEGHGLNVTAVDFPAGEPFTFPFDPKTKASVYTGDFVLHAHLTAERGEHAFEAGLHYQACDQSACLPPHTIPVTVTVVAQ
jgi:hypothetical protein